MSPVKSEWYLVILERVENFEIIQDPDPSPGKLGRVVENDGRPNSSFKGAATGHEVAVETVIRLRSASSRLGSRAGSGCPSVVQYSGGGRQQTFSQRV